MSQGEIQRVYCWAYLLDPPFCLAHAGKWNIGSLLSGLTAASGVQGLLTYKYDFNYWGVVVWDGVTGSEASIWSLLGGLVMPACTCFGHRLRK